MPVLTCSSNLRPKSIRKFSLRLSIVECSRVTCNYTEIAGNFPFMTLIKLIGHQDKAAISSSALVYDTCVFFQVLICVVKLGSKKKEVFA